MPQLEQIDTYLSQVVWLVITFGILYVVLLRTAIPHIGEVLLERQERIDEDMRRAEHLRADAHVVLEANEKAYAEARQEAQGLIREESARQASEASARQDAVGAKIARDMEGAETRIAAARDAAMENIQKAAVEVVQAAAAKLINVDVSEDMATAAVAGAARDQG